MSLSEQTRDKITEQIASHRVVLYMKGTPQQPQCGFSAQTAGLLDQLVPGYASFNVLADEEIRQGIKVYGDWPTIPQLYVDGELIGGCDIISSMFNSGELHQVLGLETPSREAPKITISDEAAKNIKAGLQGHEGLALHMSIDANWTPQFALQPADGHEISASSNDVELLFDLQSAERAKGAVIDWVDAVDGSGLDVHLPAAPVAVKSMQPGELRDQIDTGKPPLMIDVRSVEDRDKLPMPGAVALDRDTLAELQDRDKNTPMVFVCNIGNSSRGAAEHFRKLGFTEVYNLEGGMQAWSELG